MDDVYCEDVIFFSLLPCRSQGSRTSWGSWQELQHSSSAAALPLQGMHCSGAGQCCTCLGDCMGDIWTSSYMEMPHSKHIKKIKGQKLENMAEGGFVWCSNKHLCHLILRWIPGVPYALNLHNNTPQLINYLFLKLCSFLHNTSGVS